LDTVQAFSNLPFYEVGHFPTFQQYHLILISTKTSQITLQRNIAFYSVKKEVQVRQQTLFFFEKKDGCLFASTNSAISCLGLN
jgi:hypothetical protein